MTALNWDVWRSRYPALTYQDQQEFHSAIYAEHPVQRHYDSAYVAQAIDETDARTVVELGGWDGELARTILDQYPTIEQWTNIEICREAAAAGSDRHTPCYSAPILDDYYWHHGPWYADLFVASHVIEHLSTTDLNNTIQATHARALYMDAPLEDHPLNWGGFTGSHILQTGWDGVTAMCARHGYTLTWAEDHTTDPTSGGQARACLYTRA